MRKSIKWVYSTLNEIRKGVKQIITEQRRCGSLVQQRTIVINAVTYDTKCEEWIRVS